MTHSTEAHGRERPALWRTPPAVPGRPRPDRRLLLAGLLLVVSLAAFTALCLSMPVPMADMQVYRAEGAAAVDGTDLYGFTVTEWKLPATYPPFAALLFVPTTWLPVPLLKLAFMGGNLLLLGLLAHLSCRATGWPRARGSRWVVVLLAMALGLWLEPVFQTMLYGQINLLLAVLVLWDLSRPDGARGKGIAIGVAAGIKLTPAIFAVYLLLTGRRRRPRSPPPPSPAPRCWVRSRCPERASTTGPAACSTPAGSARSGSSTTSPCRASSPGCCTPPTRAPCGRSPRSWWPARGSRSRCGWAGWAGKPGAWCAAR